MAGSDPREFGQPLEEPQLPGVLGAIEACAKPAVAALRGAALGGGLELALACDARIASTGTVLGLPAVMLGIIPGARAIQMVCSGERIRAKAARDLRLVDEVVASDLQAQAVALTRRLTDKCRISNEPVPAEDAAAVDQAEHATLRAGKRRPAAVAAIDAVKNAARLPLAEGLACERAVFHQLRVSAEAFALRHLFFAERDAVRLPAGGQAAPRPVQTVAIIGWHHGHRHCHRCIGLRPPGRGARRPWSGVASAASGNEARLLSTTD